MYDEASPKLHTNYDAKQTRLIAKRASAKLITLLQKQHETRVKAERRQDDVSVASTV